MIERLKRTYRKEISTRRQELLRVVLGIKDEGKSLAERAVAIKRARNGLIEMGYPSTDWQITSCFLYTLPKKYESRVDIRTVLEAQGSDIDEGREEMPLDVIADNLAEKVERVKRLNDN